VKDWIIQIDEPLMSLELQMTTIRFCFPSGVVDCGDDFALIDEGGSYEQSEFFSAWDKKGDLNHLWPLIDVNSPRLVMDLVSLRLYFDNGKILECKNTNTVPEQANIWGFEDPEARLKHPEAEFLTNYPNDYLGRMKEGD
jgi:hypothetical protein